jgi:hypothetical protein
MHNRKKLHLDLNDIHRRWKWIPRLAKELAIKKNSTEFRSSLIVKSLVRPNKLCFSKEGKRIWFERLKGKHKKFQLRRKIERKFTWKCFLEASNSKIIERGSRVESLKHFQRDRVKIGFCIIERKCNKLFSKSSPQVSCRLYGACRLIRIGTSYFRKKYNWVWFEKSQETSQSQEFRYTFPKALVTSSLRSPKEG